MKEKRHRVDFTTYVRGDVGDGVGGGVGGRVGGGVGSGVGGRVGVGGVCNDGGCVRSSLPAGIGTIDTGARVGDTVMVGTGELVGAIGERVGRKLPFLFPFLLRLLFFLVGNVLDLFCFADLLLLFTDFIFLIDLS